MSVRRLVEIYQFFWMFESHAQQRLAWEDAEQARIARARAEMLAAMRSGLGRGPGLLPVPEPWLRTLARLAGREETFLKLAGSLVARPERLISAGWRPRVGTEAALARLAAASRAG